MSDPRHDLASHVAGAAVKAAPPMAVTLYAWLASNLPTAVAFATLVYILLQTAHLLWVWRREHKGKTPAAVDHHDLHS